MNTVQLINYVKRVAPSWSRPDILAFIQMTKDAVFGVPLDTMYYIDSTTGQPPVLTTVDGVLTYELSASTIGADIQFIRNVYGTPDVTDRGYQLTPSDPIGYTVVNGSTGNPAKIIFNSNPGVRDFYIECYKLPTEMLTESDPLEVPVSSVMPHFYNGVVGLIEKAEHGESNAYERFMKEGLEMIRFEANINVNSQILKTERQGY